MGYEFSFALTLPISIVSGFLVIAYNFKVKTKRKKNKLSNLFVPIIANLIILAVSLIIISFNAFFVKNCNFSYGFLSFILLPVGSCLFSSALAYFVLCFKRKYAFSLIIFYALFIIELFLSIFHALTHPQIFSYDFFYGYFHGAVYDEVVNLGTLGIFRVYTLILILFFLFFPYFLSSAKKLKHIGILAALIILILLGHFYKNELGYGSSRNYVQKSLGNLLETDHFKIYYSNDKKIKAHINELGKEHEFLYKEIVDELKINPKSKVSSYIYKNRKEKERLMGAKNVLIGDPFNYEMHNDFEVPPIPHLKHEMTHVLSANFGHKIFKLTKYVGLFEGLAEAVGFEGRKLTLHEKVKALYLLNKAPDIIEIISAYGFWTKQSRKAYWTAASFVRYLIDTFGIDKFKSVYLKANFKEIYEIPLGELVKKWEEKISDQRIKEADLEFEKDFYVRKAIFKRVCAHEIARLFDLAIELYHDKKYSKAIKIFDRILGFDPNNRLTHKFISMSYFYTKDFLATNLYLNRFLALKSLTMRDKLFAYKVLAKSFLYLYELENSKFYLEKITDIDVWDYYKDDAIALNEAIECECIPFEEKEFIKTDDKIDLVNELNVKGVILDNNDLYLGKLFYEKEDYDKAIKFLSAYKFNDKARFLIAKSKFFNKNYAFAKKDFKKLLKLTKSQALKEKAGEWIRRCGFYNE